MSYQLTIDEIMETLISTNHPQYPELQGLLDGVCNGLAVRLAAHLGIKASIGTFEGLGFAGTCVPFHPAYDGQELPEVFAEYEFDDAEEWDDGDV